MEETIVNKVANSSLEIFDLEDYYPTEITQIDISQWLYEGIVLKEKDFRTALTQHQWTTYQNQWVAIHCSTDAILPSWAFMLVATHLAPFAKYVVQGSIQQLLLTYYEHTIAQLDFTAYKDKPVIIKGCSKKPIPEQSYVMATQKMILYAKSIMFGEACSAVPIFKRKK